MPEFRQYFTWCPHGTGNVKGCGLCIKHRRAFEALDREASAGQQQGEERSGDADGVPSVAPAAGPQLRVREAARRRMPLDGADAQALEGALAATERERDEYSQRWSDALERCNTIMRKAENALAEVARLSALINTPATDNFLAALPLEAAHQVERWGTEHDAGKQPQDWYWLLGYLAGKALRAAIDGDTEKAKHHTISSAAALLNWHRQISDESNAMRPGIESPTGGAG